MEPNETYQNEETPPRFDQFDLVWTWSRPTGSWRNSPCAEIPWPPLRAYAAEASSNLWPQLSRGQINHLSTAGSMKQTQTNYLLLHLIGAVYEGARPGELKT
jgi:hypothetical protein